MERDFFSSFHFPPGFRFHPSDEELIVHYLLKKLNSMPLPASLIAEIELYNYNPWELPKKALFGEDEWYFFSPRDRKYPNGDRPNRATASGYWKATGTDKPIFTSGSKTIGVKKALVFYTGRPPRGIKTDWIMNEYRLPPTSRPSKLKGSMRLDDWVLCKVRQKGNLSKNTWDVPDSPDKELMSYYYYYPNIKELPSAQAYPNADAISHYGYRGCQVLASILAASEPFPQMDNISSGTFQYQDGLDRGKAKLADSLFESPPSALKGKSNEETMTMYENEHLRVGNTTVTSNVYSYNQTQFQKENFSPDASFNGSGLTEGALY